MGSARSHSCLNVSDLVIFGCFVFHDHTNTSRFGNELMLVTYSWTVFKYIVAECSIWRQEFGVNYGIDYRFLIDSLQAPRTAKAVKAEREEYTVALPPRLLVRDTVYSCILRLSGFKYLGSQNHPILIDFFKNSHANPSNGSIFSAVSRESSNESSSLCIRVSRSSQYRVLALFLIDSWLIHLEIYYNKMFSSRDE